MKKTKNNRTTKRKVINGEAVIVKQSVTDEMLDDYSFLNWSKAERGKYAERYAEGISIVLTDSNVPTKGE